MTTETSQHEGEKYRGTAVPPVDYSVGQTLSSLEREDVGKENLDFERIDPEELDSLDRPSGPRR